MNFSPNRPLSLAVVGLTFGRQILGSLRYPPAANLFRLTAVSDLRESVAHEVGAEFGVKGYTSIEKMLEDEDVDVVGLYTQPSGRARLMRDILRAGKDIMTTKPFELDAEEAEDVLREAQSLGRVIHLNSPSPELTLDLFQIQTWADEYELGRLVSARGEVWAPYREKADGSWMDDPSLCPGGAMMRFGIYLMNDIIHLAGPVENVNLIGTRVRTERPTPDNAMLTMSFASGCLASIFTSFCVDDGDRNSNGLTLNYERGTIYRNVGPANGPAKSEFSNLSLVMRQGDKRQLVAEKSFNEYSGVYQWQALHRAITEKEPLSEGYIQRIIEGVKVLEAMRGSAVSA
jgi:predicted dehydrogenase